MSEPTTERYLFPANPASTSQYEGCPAWEHHMREDMKPGEEVPCTSTVVTIIDGLPSCAWCTEAYLRGAA